MLKVFDWKRSRISMLEVVFGTESVVALQSYSGTLRTETGSDRKLSWCYSVLRRKCRAINYTATARVFRRDSPPTRSRRNTGSGGKSSSMLTKVERRLLALKANE
jgi:hypothetical protein